MTMATSNDANPDAEAESVDPETGRPNEELHPLDQEIQRWLQEAHSDEVTAFADRLPEETWIQLSAATLKDVCGDELHHDLLYETETIEDGDSSMGIHGIKTVLTELTDASLQPQDITIRWTDISDQRLVGQYRASETERLVAVEGQIDQATGVDPVVSTAVFECQRCGMNTAVPQDETSDDLVGPHECSGCERQGPFRLDKSKSEFVNYQQLRLQTPPEHAQDGVENLTVSVTGALAGEYTGDIGQKAVVNGYLTTKDTGDWQRPFLLKARSIDLVDETGVDIEKHREEIERVEKLKDPISEIVESKMLPDMYAPDGSELQVLKLAVLLQACSPPRLNEAERGDIHVFACGDPSTGKTAVSKLASKIVPRSEFVSTRVTGVGLTAAAVNDELTGWTIKSGAIVRANNGLLVIDELDKIDEDHINKLHHPMESQRVSVAVADQSVTFPAETSVLATANPKYGRFDPYEPIAEQIELPPSLLPRFDLILTMTDHIDEQHDTELAAAITDGFQSAIEKERDSQNQVGDTENVEFLRAWIAEAQTYVPELPDEAKEELEKFFVDLRQHGEDADSPIPVTARQLEGLIRLAIASARARHAEIVTDIDVDLAIALVTRSLRDVGIDPESGEFDADIIETGSSKSQRERMKKLKSVIEELNDEYADGAPYDEVVEEMVAAGVEREKAEEAIGKQLEKGIVYNPGSGKLRHA